MSSTMPMSAAPTPITSRIMQMLNAKDRLPDRLRTLFELLYMNGMTEEQASKHLHVDVAAISRDKTTLIKSLKAASS